MISDIKHDKKTVQDMILRLLAIDQIGASEILKDECGERLPFQCFEEIVVPALQIVGEKWERGEVSLSQVYLSGKISETMVDSIISEDEAMRDQTLKIAIAVLEDHHTLGKRIVISILKAGGFSVKDYGHGITVQELVKIAVEDEIDILLISTLMLNAALKTKQAISAIRVERPQMRIIVGGAPYQFDSQLWQEVGADAWGQSASESLRIVEKMSRGEF